jgi:hypothetical protein
MVGHMKKVARLLGARKIDLLFVGLAAVQPRPELSPRAKAKGRRLGQKLAQME